MFLHRHTIGYFVERFIRASDTLRQNYPFERNQNEINQLRKFYLPLLKKELKEAVEHIDSEENVIKKMRKIAGTINLAPNFKFEDEENKGDGKAYLDLLYKRADEVEEDFRELSRLIILFEKNTKNLEKENVPAIKKEIDTLIELLRKVSNTSGSLASMFSTFFKGLKFRLSFLRKKERAVKGFERTVKSWIDFHKELNP